MIEIKDKQRGALKVKEGTSLKDLANEWKQTSPSQCVTAKINDELVDLTTAVQSDDQISFFDFDTPEGKEVFWHTSAHVLAQAVLRLWPNAKPTIGPPIENGFYYDFADLHISDEDFGKIEKEMQKICKENHTTEREVFSSKEEALKAFGDNKYKAELIESFDPEGTFSAYRQGEFFDLCRGPHIPSLGKIKALKLMKISGAYWRGDSKNEMLTRIYGVSFPDRKLLKEYLVFLEEAKKRDHKIIGPKLDLFSFSELAPAMPFIHPKGMNIWNKLIDYWREVHQRAGYYEIKTPVMMSKELWEISGHWENYRENMYATSIDERDYAIKPMNCPGCMLYYKTQVRSYRSFPLRVGEIGTVHRHEPSGAVSGLFRARCFHQDDAHIFFTPEQIPQVVSEVLEIIDEVYSTFGLSYHLELSTRPEKNTIGTDEQWKQTTEGLENALKSNNLEYVVNEGDGAFYGPKIDVHIKDAIGRTWQCATIQLDMSLPERFDLEYTAKDGTRQRPVMVHRVVFGSIERFFGILIEHFKGRFPLWLSPTPVRILTVADRHLEYSQEVKQAIEKRGFQVEIDASHESISKKVRNAQVEQINYMITLGDKELESKTLSIRTRENKVHGEVALNTFIDQIDREKAEKALNSPY